MLPKRCNCSIALSQGETFLLEDFQAIWERIDCIQGVFSAITVTPMSDEVETNIQDIQDIHGHVQTCPDMLHPAVYHPHYSHMRIPSINPSKVRWTTAQVGPITFQVPTPSVDRLLPPCSTSGYSLQRRAILHFKGNDPDHLQSLRCWISGWTISECCWLRH